MRRIKILIAILFFALPAGAQPFIPQGAPKKYVHNYGSYWIDSVLKLQSLKNTYGPTHFLTTDVNGKVILAAVPGGGGAIGVGDVQGLQDSLNARLMIAKYVVTETLTGTLNGVNTTFTISATPLPGYGQLQRNGATQRVGVGNDYTISGTTITTLFVPASWEHLTYTYIKQ